MSYEVKEGEMADVLNAIRKANDKNAYEVYIPSLKRNVLFREMTTGQQKMIIKTIVDKGRYNTEFMFAIRDIIRQNCVEDIDIDTLTVIDKTAICLAMRQKSIGETFTYFSESTKSTKDINISDYIEKYKDITIPLDETITEDNITVICSYPTIHTEYVIEKDFSSILDEERSYAQVDDLFTNEIVKYISQVIIRNDEEEMVIVMDDYTFENRIKVLEHIGSKLLLRILNYIEKGNEDHKNLLIIELDSDDGGETKTTTETLGVGSGFFTM